MELKYKGHIRENFHSGLRWDWLDRRSYRFMSSSISFWNVPNIFANGTRYSRKALQPILNKAGAHIQLLHLDKTSSTIRCIVSEIRGIVFTESTKVMHFRKRH